MKTKPINRPAEKLPCILAAFITWLLLVLALIVTTESSRADSGTWEGSFNGDWNFSTLLGNVLPTNWTGNVVPDGAADTATFDVSDQTDVFLSADTEVDGIVFTAGADPFTITVNPSEVLTISGLGITNNSPTTQNFVIAGNFGGILFTNSATAGNNVTITAEGGQGDGPGGIILFRDTSNAGNATLIANPQDSLDGSGGEIIFEDNSIGGTARVEVRGDGKLDIRGHNAPGVTVGSIKGDGIVFLGFNNLTVGSNNQSTTFSGVISDGMTSDGPIIGGSLTKVGTGTLTLTGINTYTGPTTVDAGSLLVDGSTGSGQTSVNTAGLLGGAGVIGGSVVNSGIVSPGNSVALLTVRGDYTQTGGGTLRIEIGGLGTTAHDTLAVIRAATLDGTLKLVRLSNFQLRPGDQITFLTANGGVNGTFATVQSDFVSSGTIVGTQIIYLPTSVVLEGTQGSFAEVCQAPNDIAVGAALDSAVNNPRASALIEFLNGEPISKLCQDLELISPQELAAIFNLGVSLANIQTANLERRMDDIRAGSTGFSAKGFAIQDNRAVDSSAGWAGPVGAEGKSGPSSVMQSTPENRWGVFVTGLGEFTSVDDTSLARGYDLATGGVTFGVDYRVCPNFAIGLTGGYARTNADLPDNGGLDVDGGKIGLYATGFSGGFYVNGAVTGGLNSYDSRRTALLGTASGDTDGRDFTGLIAAGYDWKKGGLTIGPIASYQYTYVDFNGFTERGSLAPLIFEDQDAQSSRTALGFKGSYEWHVGHVVVKPELRAAWQHEFGDRDYSLVSRFANGAGSSFTVTGPAIGRDSLLVGAGAAVLFNDRLSAYAYYDGELARENYSSHNVSAGFRVTF